MVPCPNAFLQIASSLVHPSPLCELMESRKSSWELRHRERGIGEDVLEVFRLEAFDQGGCSVLWRFNRGWTLPRWQ